MSGVRSVVVTGADRGIGAAMCRLIAERGDRAIAACLGDSSEANGSGAEIVTGVDVTSRPGIARLVAYLRTTTVDVLIHNAGLVIEHPLGQFNYEDFQREYAVNTLGPLRVTEALLPRMREGGKIALVTSRVGSLGENQSGGLYGYRMSKAAANMAGLNLARDLHGRGIAVVCLHPGSVRTRMTAGLADQTTVGQLTSPDTAARGLLARIEELTLDTTGMFRHANGETLPW